MNEYELKVYEEVEEWKRKLTRRSGMMNRLSKKAQGKVNELIPEKVHEVMTESIKGMVKTTLLVHRLLQTETTGNGLSADGAR